jgi:Toprim domain-containing protein/CHC2-type zinc finger protein
MTTAVECRVPAYKITEARAVPIADELERRDIELRRVGKEFIGPCPVCGGRDRFAVNPGKRVWHCRHCDRGGDVIALVQHLNGVDFRMAINMLAGGETRPIAPLIKPEPGERQHDDAANSARALRLWNIADKVAGSVAEQYLRQRGLDVPESDNALRYCSPCPFGPGVTHPCMLALFRDIRSNEPRAIHRIAIGPAGFKIGKMMLGPAAGCAVKLDADWNIEYGLTIGEGIETVLAGTALGFRPAWALGSAGAIRHFPVLPGIECLTILVDHDANNTGQDATRHCARRWSAAGREVRLITPNVEGTDIADILSERAR